MSRNHLAASLGVALAALFAAAVAAAQPPAAAAPAPQCGLPRAAMDATVRAVAQSIASVPVGTIVVPAPLQSDEPAPRGRKLATRLAELLAGQLGAGVRAAPAPLPREAVRAALGKAPAWVWLRARVSRGSLQLSADLLPLPRTIWARARSPERGPVAHGFGAAPIDAEVRSYLRPLSFVEPKVAKYARDPEEIVAMACGDLDGDGGAELLTVGRQHIASLRLRAGHAQERRQVSWSEHVPIAPAPLRQPIGMATIVTAAHAADGEPYLDVSSTDRATSLRLGRTLQKLDTPRGVAVPSGAHSACAHRDGLELGAALQRCRPSDPPLAFDALGRPTDALASAVVVDGGGQTEAWLALRAGRGLLMRSASGVELTGGRVGAQLAVADLDEDGAPEAITTMDVLDPSNDAVVVYSVTPDRQLQERFRLAAPAGVQALAACPPDGPGRAPFVVATGQEIWVVR